MARILRGDIRRADLNPVRGREQAIAREQIREALRETQEKLWDALGTVYQEKIDTARARRDRGEAVGLISPEALETVFSSARSSVQAVFEMSDTRRAERHAERAKKNAPPTDPADAARVEEDAAITRASREFGRSLSEVEKQQFRSLHRGATVGTGMLRERPLFGR